jgi:hypothetical protein
LSVRSGSERQRVDRAFFEINVAQTALLSCCARGIELSRFDVQTAWMYFSDAPDPTAGIIRSPDLVNSRSDVT